MTSPSPSAAPQAPPRSGSVATQQYQQQAQDLLGTGSTSGSDLYSLGQWKNQAIDPAGFPPQLVLLLQQAGLDTSQTLSGTQLAQALLTARNPALIAAIQSMLFYAGAYIGAGVKSLADLQVGIFGPKDITALGNTISVAGQTGTPFGTYLTASANYGKANGILAQISGSATNPIPTASRADTDSVLRAQAHTLFGHDPSADEYARFQAFYNQSLLKEANDKAAAANPTLPGNLPDAYTLGQAITDQGNPQTAPRLQGGQQRLLAREGEQDLTQAPVNAQNQQDNAAIDAVNSAGQSLDSATTGSYQAAPNMSAAADQFLRQDNPNGVAQQNLATRYQTLLSILGGNG